MSTRVVVPEGYRALLKVLFQVDMKDTMLTAAPMSMGEENLYFMKMDETLNR